MTEEEAFEAEFNGSWVTPISIVEGLDGLARIAKRRSIMELLKAGVLTAVARTAKSPKDDTIHAFVVVPVMGWAKWDDTGDNHFWLSGQAIFTVYGSGHGSSEKIYRYFDVRFDPKGLPDYAPPLAASTVQERPSIPKKDLPRPEAERFSRAILEGWPQVTEREALAKAKLFFPENNVPKHWFLDIFGSIRGPRNPGKQPKVRD